ncbi:MAG: PilN domain-containing protein, partial [Acidobacteriota bacterium]
MRAVNLARRPFVNRQPVLRLAGLLWLIGAILLLINFRLYSSYWQGSAGYRQQLAEVGQEIQQADQELNQHNPALTKVNLPRENSRTKFLNSLISYRTFPWSALFDDLEQVMPLDVRLTSVRPAVQLVVEPPKPRRRRSATPRRSTSRRARAAEARAAENAAAEAAAASTTEEEKTPSSTDLKRNEVMLDIVGVAKSQEALMGFIDTLYASPSFRNPFLPGETVNLQDGSTSFSIDVIYLTRPPVFGEEGASEDPEDSEAEIPGSAGEDGPEGSQTAVVAPALEPPGEGETGGAVGNPAGASPRVSTPAEAAAALRERAEQLGSTRQQGNERTTPSRPGA